MKNNDFDLKNLPVECQDQSISKDDFKLVNSGDVIQEQKFETKPTTFLKDCFRRFKKNKSSVVAAFILGFLLVMSVFIPAVDRNDITTPHPESTYLEPKLFNSGLGFWDGTKKWKNIPVDTGENGFDETDKEKNWWPNPDRYKSNAISKKQFSDVTFTNGQSKYGKEGYVHFGYYYSLSDNEPFVEFKTRPITSRVKGKKDNDTLEIKADDKIYLTSFDTYDYDKLVALEGNKDGVTTPENYELAPLALYFTYEAEEEIDGKMTIVTKDVELLKEKMVFNIGSKLASKSEPAVELASIIREKTITEVPEQKFEKAQFSFRMTNKHNHKNTCALIRSITFDAQLSDTNFNDAIEIVNFTDATECVIRSINEPKSSIKNRAYWISTGVKNVHMSKIVYCSFVYDSYEAAYGVMPYYTFPLSKLEEYAKAKNKFIRWNIDSEDNGDEDHPIFHLVDTVTGEVLDETNFKNSAKILNKDKSPVKEFINIECDPETGEIYVDVMLSYYQYYGYKKMPRYLMGTDKSGYDMLKYAFVGLRTSLLLGIMTFAICFSFGLLYGSVSGYFGGIVDLVLERVTDILSGVPWVVVMTLVIIKAQSASFGVLLLALCLTGWIGTAYTARTQFYRFRGREYVLASRTLGASDARLIAKHILPNAMGTIITGAVLMIPGVIFSEATLSYLGLLRTIDGVISLGVTLSNNQAELTTNSYLLIFPAIIIALLMISFNLFGNGLRDAVNPSLKGEDE